MCRFGLIRHIEIQMRQDARQRIHGATVASGIQSSKAVERTNGRQHVGQVVLQPRHQRIIAQEHRTAVGEQIEPLQESLFFQIARRARAMRVPTLASWSSSAAAMSR